MPRRARSSRRTAGRSIESRPSNRSYSAARAPAPAHPAWSEAMSIEKRYFTSDRSIRS